HDRVISLPEVRAIYQATFEIGELWGPLFRILLLTGQRRGEIACLRWANIDAPNARIELESRQTKNRKPHIVHLSLPALTALEARRQISGETEFVFTTNGKTPSSGISKAKARLDKLLGQDFSPWRLHDLRRSMATALAASGIPEGVVDRIQNHAATSSAPSAVARVYQQADLLPQRAAALDRWADMVTDETAIVVRIAK
uniref:site-specific integrase n=1 Tax=uncultured Roseovarius sp. TaxID=293344 RepID=UPI0025E09943